MTTNLRIQVYYEHPCMNHNLTIATSSPVEIRHLTGWKGLVLAVALSSALVALVIGYGRYSLGSFGAIPAFLQGHRLLLEETSKSVAGVQPGNEAVVPYKLSNLSGHPVKVVGATTSCSCTMVEDLPMILSPAETRLLTAKVNVPEGKANVSGTIKLYTDEPANPVIALTYTIRVAPPRSSR